MERSNEFNYQTMQTEEYIIRINDEIEFYQVREERENLNLQIEIIRVLVVSNKKKIKQILQ
jgi:hypothetical protein